MENIHNKYLATTGDDGVIYMWDFKDGNAFTASKTQGHVGRIHCMKYNPVSNILLTCGSDYKINSWKVNKTGTIKLMGTNTSHKSQVFCLEFLPEGYFISGGFDYSLNLAEVSSMKACFSYKLDSNITALADVGESRFVAAIDKKLVVFPYSLHH